MFTGLVENCSRVISVNLTTSGAVFEIENPYADLVVGESISTNGVCLTVTKFNSCSFFVDSMPATLNVTNLKILKAGSLVNLERAMRADGRFGGHIVSGHIDTTSKLINIKQDGISKKLIFFSDTTYIIDKGSICINGISLTVSSVSDNCFEVSIIPHTMANTNLANIKIGDIVNIEYDIIAKYIEKFTKTEKKSKINEKFLRECGF